MPSTPGSNSALTIAGSAIQSSAALGKVSGSPAVGNATEGNQIVEADMYLSNIALQARDLLLYGLFKNDKVIITHYVELCGQWQFTSYLRENGYYTRRREPYTLDMF
jgi:hypothetical protein